MPGLCFFVVVKKAPPLAGELLSVSEAEGGNGKTAWQLYAAPLSVTHFVRVHFPRLRGQLLVSAAASLPDEGGGCECNEQTEGVLLLLYQIAPAESMNNLVTKQKTPRIWGVML